MQRLAFGAQGGGSGWPGFLERREVVQACQDLECKEVVQAGRDL